MRNSKKEGATLIEFIIYLGVLSWLAVLTASIGHNYVLAITAMGRRCSYHANVSSAFDLLARDIQSARANASSWHVKTEHAIIFDQGQGAATVGWRYKKGTLVRITGSYDTQKQRWKKKVGRSLMLEHLKNCVFQFQVVTNSIKAVDCSLICSLTSLESKRTFFTCNGLL